MSTLPAHWLAWLRNPQAIGAIVPSSKHLALAMLQALPHDFSADVIELGGGTGAITEVLLAALGKEHLLVVERDIELLTGLRQRWPELQLLHGDASLLDHLLPARPHRYAAIVSGLPLLNMSDKMRHDIVRASFATLPAAGVLIQFSYGWRSPLPETLSSQFKLRTERCSVAWKNLPPATVWRYSRAQ
jgi:phospholipid N-methyltransferase